MGKDYIGEFLADFRRELDEIEQGREEGISPFSFQVADDLEWIPGSERELRKCKPPENPGVEYVSLRDFRVHVIREIKNYLRTENPGYALLIPAPPGSGKTYAGVHISHWYYEEFGRRVFYAAPRHDFFTDITQAASEQNEDAVLWYEWLTRQEEDIEAGKIGTCEHVKAINTWMNRGYDPTIFCLRVCGSDYMGNECGYHAQKERGNPLIMGQHQHLFTGHSLAKECGVLIGDESPLSAVPWEWYIPHDSIMPPYIDRREPLAKMLRLLMELCRYKEPLKGPSLIAALGGPDHVLDVVNRHHIPNGPILIPRINKPEDAEDAPYLYLPHLLPLLRREAEAAKDGINYLDRVHTTKGGKLKLILRNQVNEEWPEHIVWFDATGKEDIYEAILQRPVRAIKKRIRPRGRFIQVTNRLNNISSIDPKEGDKEENERRIKQLITQVNAICNDNRFERPVVGTFMGLEEKIARLTTHFYGNRGTNQFKECDGAIVAGVPSPPGAEVEKIAKCLYFDRIEAFDTEWVSEWRKYNYVDSEGMGREYPASTYRDPVLRSVLWQLREAEVIQTAHRVRPLYRNVPVWILTNLPIDELEISELRTMREILKAPDGVDVFKWHEFRTWVARRENEQGYVLLKEIKEHPAIGSKSTAQKYIEALENDPDWEPALVRTGGPGRPRRGIKRASKGTP